MPREPSVTSACEGPRLCTFRYSSALLPKSFERPGPKSVSPATYCLGVEVVVWCRWIVDMRSPYWRCHTGHLSCGKPLGSPVVDSRMLLASCWVAVNVNEPYYVSTTRRWSLPRTIR